MENFAKCLLCLDENVSAKESHILPHFLIKRATNREGSKYRDEEMVFPTSGHGFPKPFFGRNILTEEIERFVGNDSNKSFLEESNPFTRKFIFCDQCETYFSRLESYYSTEIYQKLTTGKYGSLQRDSKGNKVAVFEKKSQCMIILFVNSIFFRCSVTRFNNFNLGKLEEKMRKVLLLYKSDNLETIINNVESNKDAIPENPIITTFIDIENPNLDSTRWHITLSTSLVPYFICLGNLTFQLYTKMGQIKGSTSFLFGLSEMLNKEESINLKSNNVKVVILDSEKEEKLLYYMQRVATSEFIGLQRRIFTRVYAKYKNNERPPEPLFYEYLHRLNTDDVPEGIRYSQQQIIKHLNSIIFNVKD